MSAYDSSDNQIIPEIEYEKIQKSEWSLVERRYISMRRKTPPLAPSKLSSGAPSGSSDTSQAWLPGAPLTLSCLHSGCGDGLPTRPKEAKSSPIRSLPLNNHVLLHPTFN